MYLRFKVYYGFRGRMPKAKYTEVGHHGIQKVQLMYRFLAPKASISGVINKVKKAVGKRSASFSETAQVLATPVTIPAANRRHFPTGKNVTKPALSGESPEVTFGTAMRRRINYAKSCADSPRFAPRKISYRVDLILRQYAKDANSTGVVHKHGKEGHGD